MRLPAIAAVILMLGCAPADWQTWTTDNRPTATEIESAITNGCLTCIEQAEDGPATTGVKLCCDSGGQCETTSGDLHGCDAPDLHESNGHWSLTVSCANGYAQINDHSVTYSIAGVDRYIGCQLMTEGPMAEGSD
jgi:hypothetical protein